ncbi:bidirectional sugar transporter N3-like [Impatiens glandulifera]|uniref:bidirectional sugar transporter N3-like n=1 Tax=Impatiens glandulifera TaxID=253017 RepID=UPI001FB06CC8|nr:bidirectional sugar transporter N3-like [Impatiens glandulifera]
MAPEFHHLLLLTFGILGNIISICVYFAPVPTFIEICKKKSTMGFQALPYIVALFSAKVWMYYALLKSNAILLISINSFGCVIETIYVIIFLLYASIQTRKQTIKLLAFLNIGVFGSILLSTFFLVPSLSRVRVVGWIAVGISIAVFAAPLNIVFQVVRTRSVEFMPFTLSFSLTISAVMWFTYGVLLFDWYVAFPNVIGFFLGLVQMVLYGVYKNGKKEGEDQEIMKKVAVAEQHVAMNMVSTMGNPDQVHPVDMSSTHSDDVDTIDIIIVQERDDVNENENEKARVNVQERRNENVDLNFHVQQEEKGDLCSEMKNLQIAVAA